jgi:hypothetical protein
MSKRKQQLVNAVRTDDFGNTVYLQDFMMESPLGGKLAPNERVSHRDGNTLNCLDDNLVLVTVKSPTTH